MLRIRIPRRGGTGRGIHGPDLVSRLPADVGERTAGIDDRSIDGESAHRAVGIRAPGRKAAVREHVSEIRARHALESREPPADIPATRAIGDHGVHGAGHPREWLDWIAPR